MKVIEIAEEQFLQFMEQSHALTRAVLREYERNLWRMGHQLKIRPETCRWSEK